MNHNGIPYTKAFLYTQYGCVNKSDGVTSKHISFYIFNPNLLNSKLNSINFITQYINEHNIDEDKCLLIRELSSSIRGVGKTIYAIPLNEYYNRYKLQYGGCFIYSQSDDFIRMTGVDYPIKVYDILNT